MSKFHSVNGQIHSIENSKVNITDLGLLRGYAIFDYFQIKDGKPYFMEDHLKRFYRSAEHMSLDIPFDFETLKSKVLELYNANGEASCGIRLVLSGGNSLDGFSPAASNLMILQHPFKHWKPDIIKNGSRLITQEHLRTLPTVKTTNYFTAVMLIPKMKEAGATDVLYHDHEGWISEASRCNFFIITSDNQLVTTKDKILNGITRKHVLKTANEIMKVHERAINLSELSNAKEAFVTSATTGIMPIIEVGGVMIGDGRPGNHTLQLKKLLSKVR